MKARHDRKVQIKGRLKRINPASIKKECELARSEIVGEEDKSFLVFLSNAPDDIDWLVKRVEHLEKLVYRYQRKGKVE